MIYKISGKVKVITEVKETKGVRETMDRTESNGQKKQIKNALSKRMLIFPQKTKEKRRELCFVSKKVSK